MSRLDEYFSVEQVVATADKKMLARLSPTAKRQIKALMLELVGGPPMYYDSWGAEEAQDFANFIASVAEKVEKL